MSRPPQSQSLWVRMWDWVPVEAEMSDPVPGSVLEATGLRVHGALEPARAQTRNGLVRSGESADAPTRAVEYLVTGTATTASDFDTSDGSGHGVAHAEVNVVLLANGLEIQVQTRGWARDVPQGARLSVQGELLVIPFYEWTNFDLVDTRSDWAVEDCRRLPDGDFRLRLAPLETRS